MDGYYLPDSDVVKNVPQMFVILSVIYFVLITIGSCLIIEKPHDHHLHHSQHHDHDRDHDISHSHVSREHDSSLAQTTYNGTTYNPLAKDSNISLRPISNSNNSNRKDDSSITVALVTMEGSGSHRHSSGSETADGIEQQVYETSESEDRGRGVSLDLDVGPVEMMRMPLAWHLASCFITTTIGGMFLLGMYKVYGQSVLGGGSESYLSQMGGIASLLNACGRIAWGELGDLIGPIETLIILVRI